MSKHLHGGSSASKTARYSRGIDTSKANKLRKLLKHLRKYPNDRQSTKAIK